MNDQSRICFRWTGNDAEDVEVVDFPCLNNMSRIFKPVSPGEMLADEFLKPLGMSNYRLSKEIGVPVQRIGKILAGRRTITADTDLRMCRFFGLSDGWWLRQQADYDTEVAKGSLAKTLAKIRPWKDAAEERFRAPARRCMLVVHPGRAQGSRRPVVGGRGLSPLKESAWLELGEHQARRALIDT